MNQTVPKTKPFRLKVWGENACFTRPELKVERVSYDVMTPSAARGVLEAILWKPAIRWVVERIDVLNPIRWESVRRNEVGQLMSPRSEGVYIEDARQQKAGMLLREVAYIIHAHLELTDRAGPQDNLVKFQEMFLRRAGAGQCFNQPYLGCREFSAHFELIGQNEEAPSPIDESPELGLLLFDIVHDASSDKDHVHHCGPGCRASFFRAKLERGVLWVPLPGSKEVLQ
ncbi:type I-C CRISPR-associated protein Cas5c [Myxococcota bacterium]|nr:type I-C CRISPR-associated protein Cas5c [Myxococcota bacterium]MBU1410076.1 type I-C CRISPR-associated protein Cas5c [Myxococcota bacterium]MBU1512178.1 type I-C CRISPR-associated protein Cas5c [Myxococcota bacterium]